MEQLERRIVTSVKVYPCGVSANPPIKETDMNKAEEILKKFGIKSRRYLLGATFLCSELEKDPCVVIQLEVNAKVFRIYNYDSEDSHTAFNGSSDTFNAENGLLSASIDGISCLLRTRPPTKLEKLAFDHLDIMP